MYEIAWWEAEIMKSLNVCFQNFEGLELKIVSLQIDVLIAKANAIYDKGVVTIDYSKDRISRTGCMTYDKFSVVW